MVRKVNSKRSTDKDDDDNGGKKQKYVREVKHKEKKIKKEKSEEDDILSDSWIDKNKSKPINIPSKYTFSLDRLLSDRQSNPKDDDLIGNISDEDENNYEDSDLPLSQEDPADKEALRRLMNLPDELQKDIRTENAFPFWPKKLSIKPFEPETDTSQMNQVQRNILKFLGQGSKVQTEIVRRGWIMQCFPDHIKCPDSVLRWHFSIMCFAKELRLASSAYIVLDDRLTRRKPSISLLCGLPYPQEKFLGFSVEAVEGMDEWVPSYQDFVNTFHNYGMDTHGLIEIPGTVINSQKDENLTMEEKKIPLGNLRLVLEYLGLCISRRPSKYTDQETISLIQLIVKISLDDRLADYMLRSDAAIARLMSRFSTKSWYEDNLPKLCKILSSSEVTSNYQNYPKLVRTLPLTLQRGKELQSCLSYAFLQIMHEVDTSTVKTDAPQVSEVIKLLPRLNDSPDYSKMLVQVQLIDLLFNEKFQIRSQSKEIGELVQKLQTLNSQIKEISGYNLLLTKVKEYLVFTTTKLSLLAVGKKMVQSNIEGIFLQQNVKEETL